MGGKIQYAQIAANAFGQALGDSIVAETRIAGSEATLARMGTDNERDAYKAAIRGGQAKTMH